MTKEELKEIVIVAFVLGLVVSAIWYLIVLK
jgi:hypothetical protein